MEPWGELLGTTHEQTFQFFFVALKDVSEPSVDRAELLYNASVLAHYAQVSTHADVELPAPADLSDVFDRFVYTDAHGTEAVLMESAGTQCLLAAGFFEDQNRRRHNIRWYSQLGSGFFDRAAAQERSARKAKLFEMMARHFEAWRQRHARLGRELRSQPYLLPPQPPRP